MQMLDAGGIPTLTDNIRTADGDNPQGYYELEQVKRLPQGEYSWLDDAGGKVVKIISTLLVYLPSKYHYKIIFMRRHIPEIIASQAKMITHRGTTNVDEDETETGNMLEKHVQEIDTWMKSQANIDCLYFPFNDSLKNPSRHIQQIASFLNVQLDEEQMKSKISLDLYRNRNE